MMVPVTKSRGDEILMYCTTTPVSFLQEKISAFDAEDFVFQLGGPDPDVLFDGVRVRSASVAQFPALEGQGLSTILVNIGPCGINQPRVHPRATTVGLAHPPPGFPRFLYL